MGKSIEANMIIQAETLLETARSGLGSMNPLIARASDLVAFVTKYYRTDSSSCLNKLWELEEQVDSAVSKNSA